MVAPQSSHTLMAAYDPIADWYAAQARTGSLQAFHLTTWPVRLLEMAGDVSGKRVLDAGCGEGHVARLFASHGAEVVAVDISPRLLNHARTLRGAGSARDRVHRGGSGQGAALPPWRL